MHKNDLPRPLGLGQVLLGKGVLGAVGVVRHKEVDAKRMHVAVVQRIVAARSVAGLLGERPGVRAPAFVIPRRVEERDIAAEGHFLGAQELLLKRVVT